MALTLEKVVGTAADRSEKVCEWVPPENLQELLDLDLGDTGESEEKLLQRCRDVIKYSVKTAHPCFFNQLYCGLEPYSLAASFITEALKPSIYTYEVAPVFTLMETVVLKKIIEVVGWEDGDGIFNAGGSLSNMYAINLARYHCFPEIKKVGTSVSPRLVLFTSQEHLLQDCYSAKASYLFQQDKFYDVSFDFGDKSIQCSRKPDAFKIWLLWKALGTSRLEQRVDRALAMAQYLTEQIKARQGFRLLLEPEYANVCFWYIPPSLRNVPDGPDFWNPLQKVAPMIKERMIKKGSLMVGYQAHGDKANFFRMIIISPQVCTEDMDFVLDEIHRLGHDL
uniref:Uncharacterized protein n=1 Tax=Knipowitschia caucasica TaxID=637954 RepID=A0AAV2MAS8_KNICA